MNMIDLKSRKLVAALLAAGVLGGVGATAVGQLHSGAQAQQAAAVTAVSTAPI